MAPSDDEEIAKALKLLHSTWEDRPPRAITLSRPTGRLLRDFELALQVGDFRAAYGRLRELKESGRLSAENETYLEIRYRDARGAWREILDLEQLDVVLAMRRPREITESIARAVYRAELLRYEETSDPEGARLHFSENLVDRYRLLFRTRAGSIDPDVVKLFMLFAVCEDPPRSTLRDQLLSLSDLTEADAAFVAALAGQHIPSPPTPAEDLLTEAEIALSKDDYERAFALVAEIPASRDRAEVLVRAAYELETVDAASIALEAATDLSPEEFSQLVSTRAMRSWLEALQSSLESQRSAPTGWQEWLARTNAGPWDGAVEVARERSARWASEEPHPSPQQILQLATLFGEARGGEEDDLVDQAIPFFLSYLERMPPGPSLRPLYEQVFIFLLTRERLGRLELEATTDVLWLQLIAGVSDKDYEQLVGDLGDAWRRVGSPAFAWWAADVAEVLASFSGSSLRASFVAGVVGDLTPHARRCDPVTLELINSIGRELDVPGVPTPELSEVGDADPFLGLDGMKIGIYSLMESSCRRAKEFLEDRARVKVTLNHDTVGGGGSLLAMVQESDVVVMAVRSAQHAATDFIKQNRPRGAPLIVASGKGSSSMIRAIVEWLDPSGAQRVA
jgi:hypothetical protein